MVALFTYCYFNIKFIIGIGILELVFLRWELVFVIGVELELM